ncbi:MAG: polyphosphate polymerase domain-containing protein, partial [Propioniciclava sp.]
NVATLAAPLPGLTLAQLNAAASLLTRVDRKYLIDNRELADLWAELPADVGVLDIGGERTFGYHSTYYDTKALESFRATAQPRRRRWKVRTRAYATGDAFLEVKTRRGAATVKERISWDAQRVGLGADSYRFIGDALGRAGVADVPRELVPRLETRYTRTTVLLPADGARVTLDEGLTWTDPASGATAALGEAHIVETKAGRSPSRLDRALWARGHRPVRISKYAVGLATLHPDLPRNRWHRLLARLETA